jgi:hypothetical protein
MPASQPTTREQVDRVIALIKRALPFWKRALLIFVVGMAIAVPYVWTRPRSYKSETVIIYQENGVRLGGNSDESARRLGARLKEVLISRASLEPIISEMHKSKPLGRGELIEAVDDMRKSISFRAREGDTFEISYTGSTPQEAKDVTEKLALCMVNEASSRRKVAAENAKKFLQEESDKNAEQLRTKEAELAKFVILHPQMAARLQGQMITPVPTTNTAASGTTDPVLSSLEQRAARIDRQLRAASNPTPAPPPRPVATFVPPPESAELQAARRDFQDKSGKFTDRHPDVIAAQKRLKAAEAAQEAANQAALDAFNAQQAKERAAHADDPPPKTAADEEKLRKELENIQALIAQRRATLAKGGDAGAAPSPLDAIAPAGSDIALEVEFRRLQREVAELKERQTKIDKELFEKIITTSNSSDQVTILDPAYFPVGAISKPRSTQLATFMVVILALAIGAMVISAALDDRILDRVDLERLDVLPIVGVIPRAELPPAGGTGAGPPGPDKNKKM